MITGYHNLPIGKYLNAINAMMKKEDDMDAHVAMIASLEGITDDEAYNMPLPQYQELSERYAFMIHELPKSSNKIKDVYRLGGMELTPIKDVKKFTAAQYIDYQQLSKEDGKIVELLSCLLVPKGCTYANGYDLADAQKAISEHLSVLEVSDLSAFFLRKLKSSMRNSLTYLALQIMRETPRKEWKRMLNPLMAIRSLLKNGDGLHMFNR